MVYSTLTDKIFFLSIAGLVTGIFLHSFVSLGISFSLFFILLGGVVFALSYHTKGRLMLLGIFLCWVGIGMLRYDATERSSVKGGLETSVGYTVTLQGFISDEPDVRETNTRLVLEVSAEEGTTRLLLVTLHEPQYVYGDRVEVQGELLLPKNFQDEQTLRMVDFASYLAKDGIYYEMFQPKISLLLRGTGNKVVEGLFAFKNAFIKNIGELIPEPHSSLLGGLVVGAKQSLGKELLDDFRAVGIIHIVVLSGYNITIIAVFIEWLLSRLRKNLRLGLSACAMLLFALMVGASATVIRATVMALLALLARGTGRIYAVTRALLVAGAIMLLHNPKILVFDVSFQLSFLATLGLIYVSPFVEQKVLWVTERWHIREIVVATLATQIFVLPFLLYKTGLLSLVSLPVNLLVLLAIPFTMLFGFLAGLVAFVSVALATPLAIVAYGFLADELTVVEWFAKLPFASVALPYFPLWLLIFWYTVYAVFYFLWRKKQSSFPFGKGLLS
ncbi:MAG: ComEC/Rec2 family competence protein [bacterium]|nr:ComEC/Rec2 family competence protein [bacterium]